MALVLGIDTASTHLDLGLLRDGKDMCAYTRFIPSSHAEHIHQAVAFFLRSNGIDAGDISHAGVAVGPGSFTGLRIGVAFVKGFFFGRDVRIAALSSLETVARGWRCAEGRIAVAFEARRGQVFSAFFSGEHGTIRRESDDTLQTVEQFCGSLSGGDTVLVDTLGYGASRLGERIREYAHSVFMLHENPVQRGRAAALSAWETPHDSPAWVYSTALLPRYIQGPYTKTA
jgi:tRNA threonylcarbamoyl adenosine modification protein YeaZ